MTNGTGAAPLSQVVGSKATTSPRCRSAAARLVTETTSPGTRSGRIGPCSIVTSWVPAFGAVVHRSAEGTAAGPPPAGNDAAGPVTSPRGPWATSKTRTTAVATRMPNGTAGWIRAERGASAGRVALWAAALQ